VAALTLLSLAVGYRRDGACRAWLVDAGESALLWGYFLVVPPLVSVGVYFALWHSLRHVGRLAAVDPEGAASLSAGRPAAALSRFGREAAPTTALSLLFIAAAAVVSPTGGAALAGVYLVVIAVLTLPHTVVVTGMDLAERAAR
jgi:Brp/Blh family beta-carotene 15,15'-monooxygenase